MARWLVYSLFILAVVAAAIFIVFPQIRDSLLGFFERSEISLLRAEEKDVEFDGEKVQTMLAVTVEFLVREQDAENGGEDFVLRDAKGEEVWRRWYSKEIKRDDEKNLTRISGVMVLPRKFRRGTFWLGDRKLGSIAIPAVPYEAR